ncbi:MAG: ROK family protein [Filimonas sp.]|nr:ROK family protein [Filimonas sp.]
MNNWGIDLGGTKIECAVLDENNQVRIRKRIATEAANGYQHILSQIKTLVDQVAGELGEQPLRVGFATPGVLEPSSRLMKNSNTTVLNGMPLQKDLEAKLGVSVKLANDANCFALAEALMGIGKEYKTDVVFGVIMGTGVGGGLVVNGKIIEGLHGIAGEWGHNELEPGGVDCYCGKKGCVEKVIAGPSLEAYYLSISGEQKKLQEIVAAYKAGNDTYASQTIERLLEYYGKAVSVLVNILDPGLIVIGGGVGNVDELYSEGYERIKKYVFNKGILNTPIRKPLLGDSAGVFGAALL